MTELQQQGTFAITVVRRSAGKQIEAAEARGALVLDLTSKGAQPWVQFSPFYPHRGIPVPMNEGLTTASVEGAWQGLKVFEHAGVDLTRLRAVDMKNLKRSQKKLGRVLGHRGSINAPQLLDYIEARKAIYLPLYRWVLDNRLGKLVEHIREVARTREVVLLDYETNGDPDDRSAPLSHAALVKAYVEGRWPS